MPFCNRPRIEMNFIKQSLILFSHQSNRVELDYVHAHVKCTWVCVSLAQFYNDRFAVLFRFTVLWWYSPFHLPLLDLLRFSSISKVSYHLLEWGLALICAQTHVHMHTYTTQHAHTHTTCARANTYTHIHMHAHNTQHTFINANTRCAPHQCHFSSLLGSQSKGHCSLGHWVCDSHATVPQREFPPISTFLLLAAPLTSHSDHHVHALLHMYNTHNTHHSLWPHNVSCHIMIL